MLVGTTSCELLFEEEYDERGSIDLCPKHALDYEGRRAQTCYQSQCNQVGFAEEGSDGVRRCRHHSLPGPRRLPPRDRGEPPDAHDLKRLRKAR